MKVKEVLPRGRPRTPLPELKERLKEALKQYNKISKIPYTQRTAKQQRHFVYLANLKWRLEGQIEGVMDDNGDTQANVSDSQNKNAEQVIRGETKNTETRTRSKSS
jgi:hypothetical protein